MYWYIPLAIMAAICYAIGSVLEQYEAAKVPEDKALKFGLLTALVHKPLWVLGFAFDIAGFAFQAWALALGPVVIVQPLLVTAILVALPLGVKYTGQMIGPREWTGAIIVTLSLAAFVILADVDSGNTTDVAVNKWIIASAIVFGIVFVSIIGGWRTQGNARAVLWGIAGGVSWGIMSVYLQTTMDLFDKIGIWPTFATAYPYLVGVSGGAGLIIAQSAFQTGKLAPSLATFESLQPITAVILGVVLFEQRLHGEVVAREIGAVLALVVMIVGIVILSTSKVVAAGAGALDPDDEMLKGKSGAPAHS